MTKHYISDSNIAINIILSNGKSVHIAFTPLSSGGSTYSTNVEQVQKSLEAHYRFNSLFWLASIEEETPTIITEEEVNKEEEASSENALRKVVVSDIGEAKDYLADTFGISRTSLRGKKSIIDAAATNGVIFQGL